MQVTTAVATTRHFVVRAVQCRDDHAHWSDPEPTPQTRLVLVRRGRFRIESRGRPVTVDPTFGYLHQPGRPTRFAHPAGGDLCTSITVIGESLTSQLGSTRPEQIPVDARLELAHRALLSTRLSIADDPDFAGAEAVAQLIGLALRRHPDERAAPGRHDVADRAREALLADEAEVTGLVELSRLLGVTPAHLSRTFRHHIGMTVSRYRNRLRVSRALQQIDAGEDDLSGLAHRLGFSDQAHFSRIMRRELGSTPGRVRALLGAGT